MKAKFIYSFLVLCLFSSCGNDADPLPEIYYGYEYFPLDGIAVKEYKVIEERYTGSTIDSNEYFLKEEFQESSVVSDETQQVVKRYKRLSEESDWVFDSLWVIARNEERAFSIENNLRLVKLHFPLSIGNEWDRNEYNVNNDRLVILETLEEVSTEGKMTAKVSVESFTSLVNRDIQYEVYAKNIGLINQYSEHLNHQPGKDTVGTRVGQILTAYEIN